MRAAGAPRKPGSGFSSRVLADSGARMPALTFLPSLSPGLLQLPLFGVLLVFGLVAGEGFRRYLALLAA